jgi:hypothetical protein
MTETQNPSFDALPPLQARVAYALAAGASISAAAQQIGVHRATIHNWMKDPAFNQAVGCARLEYAESLRDQLDELGALALDTIRQLLTDPNTPASVRLRAAMSILERPQFPDRGWALPAQAYYPAREQRIVEDLALIESSEPPLRQPASTLENLSSEPVNEPPAPVSRNARCPCGSGQKYKRCCADRAALTNRHAHSAVARG